MSRKITFALTIALVVAFMLSGVAFAITIAVDGIKEAAWDGSGGQTPGIQADPDESTIDNRYDVKEIRWTNDALGGSSPYGNIYFLMETYANFDIIYPPFQPQIMICIDVDNSTSTGTTVSGYCNNMSGVDRRITANLSLGTVTIQRWTGTFWQAVSQPSGGMRSEAWQDTSPADGIADLPYVEIGVDLESLGITNTATCLTAMPSAVYYDNGMLDDEDAVPNSSTFSIGCGTPTAITLNSLQAQPTTSPVVPVALIGVSAVALIGIVYFTRRSRRKTA
jgi:hypothetical protein